MRRLITFSILILALAATGCQRKVAHDHDHDHDHDAAHGDHDHGHEGGGHDDDGDAGHGHEHEGEGHDADGDEHDNKLVSDLMGDGKTPSSTNSTDSKVPGLPEIPKLTGNRLADKANIKMALEQLQTVWSANKAAVTSVKMAAQPDMAAQLAKLAANNKAYQEAANSLQDLLEQLKN